MAAPQSVKVPRSVNGVLPQVTLADLLRRNAVELERMYREAPKPTSVGSLEGHPKGRVLAVRGFDGSLSGIPFRALSAWKLFPWGGKSFEGQGVAGRGLNRIHVLGRHEIFPFHTEIRPSAVDGAPCIALNYDLKDNLPFLISQILDELREVSPGLFMGPALLKTKTSSVLVLWFALDTRTQATPIGAHPRKP